MAEAPGAADSITIKIETEWDAEVGAFEHSHCDITEPSLTRVRSHHAGQQLSWIKGHAHEPLQKAGIHRVRQH